MLLLLVLPPMLLLSLLDVRVLPLLLLPLPALPFSHATVAGRSPPSAGPHRRALLLLLLLLLPLHPLNLFVTAAHVHFLLLQ